MKIPSLVAVAATALLTLSACGNGGSSTAAAVRLRARQAARPHPGCTVAQTSLGKVLVDGRGLTLYMLSADGHDHSTCSSPCLQFWPAVAPGHAGQDLGDHRHDRDAGRHRDRHRRRAPGLHVLPGPAARAT